MDKWEKLIIDEEKYQETLKKRQEFDLKYPFWPVLEDIWYFVFYGIPNRVKDAILEVKWGFQRMFRGYDDTAFWSLRDYIANIALPVLEKYRTSKHGIPLIIGGEEKENRSFEDREKEWNDILEKMIRSFRYIKNGDEDYDFSSRTPEWYINRYNEIDEGLLLFGKYFKDLWD